MTKDEIPGVDGCTAVHWRKSRSSGQLKLYSVADLNHDRYHVERESQAGVTTLDAAAF